MFIFSEDSNSTVSFPKNVQTKKNKIRFEAILQTAGDVNKNKRRYSKKLIQEGLEMYKSRIDEGLSLGECDHPIDVTENSAVRQTTVLLSEASHVIRDVSWDGNKLIGVVETLAATPKGRMLRDFIVEDHLPIGFSLRGMGDLKEIRENAGTIWEVQGPLQIITYDVVSNPSHAGAKFIKITESVSKDLNESYNMLVQSNNYIEENGMIKTANGLYFLPNDFDRYVNSHLRKLQNKFRSR